MVPPCRVLHGEAAIRQRLRSLASEIHRELPEDSFLLVGVLTGSFVFVADLARELSRLGCDPRIELAWTALYDSDGKPNAEVRLVRDLQSDPAGRPVLLVDDILDTGRTLSMLRDRITARGPSWLRTCVLLDKPGRPAGAIQPDFWGFHAPSEWVFGYGLDTEGEGRALPDLVCRSHHGD